MTLALLFSGQGAQHPQMLQWLAGCTEAQPLLAQLSQQIGADWRERLQDREWATRNAVAQPLLVATSLAAWRAIAAQVRAPVAVAGYSVGELAAFAAAGVIGDSDALALAAERAQLMDRCAARQPSGLLAVGGITEAALHPMCTRWALEVAIRIDPMRAVVGGTLEALARAEPELDALGADLSRLPVALASHTSWMADAASGFAQRLEALVFKPPRAALVVDLDGGTPRRGADLKHALAQQIAHTVQWDRCLETIAERRVRCVLEIGPGCALARMWQAREPDVPARSADEFRSVDALVRWVAASVV